MPPQSEPTGRTTTTDTNNANANDADANVNTEYRYLTPKSIQALKDFQYNGVDHSLLYKHVLSPLAGFLVDHATPSTIAPNTITLFGFSFMIAVFLIMNHYCPTLDHCSVDNHVPEYIFLLNGMALLIYQTLDNMDGKQARKTGSSSPLGLFFDHGLDACNVIIGTINTLCVFAIKPDDWFCIFTFTFCTMLPFYVSTWEEYYTHKLVLPVINGASEGVFLSAAFSFVSWWWGQEIWQGTAVYDAMVDYVPFTSSILEWMPVPVPADGIQNLTLLSILFVICTMQEIGIKIFFVVKNHGFKTIINLAPIIVLVVMSCLIVKSNPDIFLHNQRICLALVGLIFVEMTTALMIDHMTRRKYDSFRNTLCPLFFLFSLVVMAEDWGVSEKQLQLYLMVYLSGLSSFLMVKTKRVITEVCSALGIWCFDIVTPHPNRIVVPVADKKKQ